MIQDNLKITGDLKVQIFDKTGAIKEERLLKNLVVTNGKTFIAARIVGTPTAMSNMAVGAGTTAAAAGDTALGAELGRVALTSSTSASNVVTYVATFAPGTGTGAVTEAGIFNAGSGGTMLCRTVFSVINKGADDTMSVTWQITVN